MFTLKFPSEPSRSKYPTVRGDSLTYKRVRKTTVTFERTSEKTGKVLETKSASVTCHPNEQDVPALGQKYAMQALTRQFEDRKMREVLWHEFATRISKSASRIMGKSPDLYPIKDKD